LEGDRPARKLARASERSTVRHIVDLDDDAVGVEVKRSSLVLPFGTERDELLQPETSPPVTFHRQAPCAKLLQRFRVQPVRDADSLVDEGTEPPLGDESGIEIPHGAGSSVARILKDRLAGLLALTVDPFERLAW